MAEDGLARLAAPRCCDANSPARSASATLSTALAWTVRTLNMHSSWARIWKHRGPPRPHTPGCPSSPCPRGASGPLAPRFSPELPHSAARRAVKAAQTATTPREHGRHAEHRSPGEGERAGRTARQPFQTCCHHWTAWCKEHAPTEGAASGSHGSPPDVQELDHWSTRLKSRKHTNTQSVLHLLRTAVHARCPPSPGTQDTRSFGSGKRSYPRAHQPYRSSSPASSHPSLPSNNRSVWPHGWKLGHR